MANGDDTEPLAAACDFFTVPTVTFRILYVFLVFRDDIYGDYFRPRDVFIGEKAEGNFIGCDRNEAHFLKGRIDHFRIYRRVHDDFDALDEVPPALTQVLSQQTCEKAARFAMRLASTGRGRK